MGNRFQPTACPLCHDGFDDPVEYREHLAFMHDLVDDEGAETTLAEAEPEALPQPAPPAPIVAPLESVPVGAAWPARPALTDPVAVRVDRRVLPGLVLAIALQLVLALIGLTLVGDDAASELTSASGPNEATVSSHDGDPAPGRESARNAGSAGATTAPPTTVAPTVDTRGDQARADAFTLRTSDFPAGWQQLDPSDLGGDEDTGDVGPDCTAPDDPTETDALTGESPTAFAHDTSFAFGGALVLRTERDAIRTMDVIRELTPCFGEQMLAGAGEGAPSGVSISHGEFSPLGYPTYGDETTATSMPVTFSGPGGRVPLRLDVLAVRRDRAVAFVMVIVGANDFTPQQERSMLSAVADRMAPRSI
jgi:hypothetical protein